VVERYFDIGIRLANTVCNRLTSSVVQQQKHPQEGKDIFHFWDETGESIELPTVRQLLEGRDFTTQIDSKANV
jgi:hypothetical protein